MKHLLLPLLATAALASEHAFSVHDDVLAYPQFEVIYSDSYVLRDDALKLLQQQASREDPEQQVPPETTSSDISQHISDTDGSSTEREALEAVGEHHELMRLNGKPYLCSIPVLDPPNHNKTSEPVSEAEQQKEVARATDRGWQLLQELDGKCLYYMSGWWSYSFCYNSQIKQFHQLPPGQGAPMYPPQEDPGTPAYVLGRFEGGGRTQEEDSPSSRKDITELQTTGETRYLVQKLGGGTTCDLTGKDRKIEIQFHCHPQSTDRIGFIKEVTTCTYLMVVYTPRLCNDVAFLPPQENRPHPISCREILKLEQVAAWKASKEDAALQKSLNDKPENQQLAGEIEIGRRKFVGADGRRIEKGRVVTPPEERTDIVAKKENGQVRQLSKEDMEKMEIDPETIDSFQKQLEDIAGDKDWKLEVVDEVDGVRHVRHIRGVVQGGADGGGDQTLTSQKSEGEGEEQEGSEEEYKEEL